MMTLAQYHREVKRLWEAAWASKFPDAKCWLKRSDCAADHAEGLTPEQCALNWLAGRKVCGDTSVGRAAAALAGCRHQYV
jgi:hypothetical protein